MRGQLREIRLQFSLFDAISLDVAAGGEEWLVAR
jgi:hypothetical protein